MTVRQLIPEGLARMAPGPRLSAVLADLDIRALAGSDLVEVLQARARQLSHDQAQLLAVMAEIGRCDPAAGPDEVIRRPEPPGGTESLLPAADEIRAALAWTRNAAYREYRFAQSLAGRLPAVFTALDDGVICRSKAWLFSELCAQLTDEQAQVVCARLLPQAGRLTTGELAARIKKLAIALDPEWAARRYAGAVRDRDVIGYLDEEGTATVSGRRLPTDQAAAACARIEELARAAKRAGYPGRIGPLRADVYLGLLDGRWTNHTREEIITDLLARATPGDTAPDPTPDDGTSNGPTTQHPADGDMVVDGDTVTDGDVAADGDTGAAVDGSSAPEHGDSAGGAQRPAAGARVGVELRVGVGTLLGRNRHPGEVPGWGPVTAETARGIAAAQWAAEWRFAITDPDGRLILAGITRRRPATMPEDEPEAGPPCRDGIVELHLPATLLAELAADLGACGNWAAVITDLVVQYDAYRDQHVLGKPRFASTQDPGARFAGAALRRHVQVRDRYCVMIGCRCPAHQADLDHTVDHSRGGATTEANSGPLCKHDHRVKHEGGWRLCQPEPGHFVWISPLGRTYHTWPQLITTDLPDPVPGPDYLDYPSPVTGDEDGPILYRPPSPPEPAPPPPRPDPDEPPPF
ncbi:MAG: DUF222 domain-containing protein [Pseudonocardiaceae bacterium]